MSRATEVLNDLELGAKRLGMSIEEAVSILLGKHPTHVVVQAHKETAETNAKVAENNAASAQAAEGNASAAASTQPGSASATNAPGGEAAQQGTDTPGAAA